MKPIATARGRQSGAIVAIGTAGALLLLSAGSAVAASHPPSLRRIAVPQGVGAAALSKARVIGPAAASRQEQVSFILKARNLGALEARASAGTSSHLSVSQFAQTYGQTQANITGLKNYLTGFGITCMPLADGLDISTTGTVAEYNQALGIKQNEYRLPAVGGQAGHPGRPAVSFHGTAQPTTLPGSLASFVLSILGLSSYPAGTSNAVHTPALRPGVRPAATQKGNLTPAAFASRYNLTPLLKAGHTGQGQTIGIVTLASMNPSDATHFWSSVLKIQTKPGRLTLQNIDGGAGPVSAASGSGETTLDVEQSGALAPNANVVVYQAPNTDAGFIDGFAAAASQGTAGAVSSSWGSSETAVTVSVAARKESRTYAQAFDEMFLELAAQGQSAFVAAGDFGAYDAFADAGTTNLSVDEPGSSPWITDAGGTTLPGTIPVASNINPRIKTQRAWGWDWLWPFWKKLGFGSEHAFAKTAISGGGGGFSAMESAPGYQLRWLNVRKFSAVKYLTPTGFVSRSGVRVPIRWNFNGRPRVIHGTGQGRAVPDLSANADPFTGYEEYFSKFTGNPLETGWGGTSFVAPQLAGATAVIDSALHRWVGFWNPAIYRFAAGKNSPFTSLGASGTSNDNLYYSGTKGNLFNAGTGLGIPDLARLAANFGS